MAYKTIILIVLIIILWAIALSFYGFITSIYPGKYVSEETPEDFGWDYESVDLTTTDNFNIKGWFVPAKKKSNSTIVMLHGYPFDKGNILPLGTFLQEDFNLFFIDFRGSGESQSTYVSFGNREGKDVQAAIDYAKKEKGQKNFGLFGFSMGGAVGIIAAADNKDIKAVVADSAYAEISAMAASKYDNYPVLNKVLGLLTEIYGSIWFRTTPGNISPINHIANVKAPLLLIHGTKDTEVPVEQAHKLRAANDAVELWLVEGLDHAVAHEKEKEEYESRVSEFFKKNLKS